MKMSMKLQKFKPEKHVEKIILASTSPRRSELLNKMGVEFEVIAPDFDENIDGKSFSYELIENIALNKARSVLLKIKTKTPLLIIAADTVVVLDDEILTKPKDENDAFSILKKLSGKKHFVVTSVAMVDCASLKEKTFSETSFVTFVPLSDEQISKYIKDKKPFDKAGAYGIQELPDYFNVKIEGCFDNVVGLPTSVLLLELKSNRATSPAKN